MKKQQLAERRRRNQELAQQDAKHRCTICKRSFAESGQIVESFGAEGRFCSTACLEEAAVREYHEDRGR